MTQNAQTHTREFEFGEQDFRFLATLAHERTGIVLAEHKRDMVYGRLARRLRSLGYNSFSDYCALLSSEEGSGELDQLINALTTNLTSFFREPYHFEHLRNEVITPMLQSKGQKHLRIWSAGCSSGMEPYSIAMTVKDAIPNLPQWDARILATDIDTNMLGTGTAGEYSTTEYEKIPSRLRSHVKSNGRLIMSEELKQLIAFRYLNLLEPWPMKALFDAIFCRNVVIYFDKPTKEKLFDHLADMMKPNGWLYIGHSENLHNICDRFQLVGRTIYRKVK